ncbi:hypothetical protein C7S15_5838 [Burkholderia cepacia]|nr:hypothetical protein [Burkholderia cepacia]
MVGGAGGMTGRPATQPVCSTDRHDACDVMHARESGSPRCGTAIQDMERMRHD